MADNNNNNNNKKMAKEESDEGKVSVPRGNSYRDENPPERV